MTAGLESHMRIVLSLLVRDEEDILDSILRFHYAQGVDFVIATDNNLVDGTPEILERHAAQGGLLALRESQDDSEQASWVTRMARLAAIDHGADWVINGDADEFWWPTRGTLRSTLSAVPVSYGIIRTPRFDFLRVVDQQGPFYTRMIIRKRDSYELGAPLLSPKICHRACPTVEVSEGNHRVAGCDSPLSRSIAHNYPAFSHAQLPPICQQDCKGGCRLRPQAQLAPGRGRDMEGSLRRVPARRAAGVLRGPGAHSREGSRRTGRRPLGRRPEDIGLPWRDS